MLKPLDSEKLAALLGPRKDARCGQTSAAILLLGEMGDLRNGVYSLLETHPATFEARARFEDDNLDIWSIRFRDSPFRSLHLEPASETAIEVYAFGESLCSFEMLGCPHNWVKMLNYLWNYGYERQVVKVKKGSMLPLLDLELYDVVANRTFGAGSSVIHQAHFCFDNKDVAQGVYMLLVAFRLCSPQLHREAASPVNWHIDFKDSPLRTLRIQQGPDCRGIAIYAFDRRAASFLLTDSPPRGSMIGDLESRQRMLEWIWDYGNKRIEDRLKYEAAKCLGSKSRARVKQKKNPTLHKVLFPADFKAQHAKSSKWKAVRPNRNREDDTMDYTEEVDIEPDFEKHSSRQLFGQKSPLRATDPNAQLGQAPTRSNVKSDQTVKTMVECINIGGLNIQESER